ncbi:MAG TPA: hypothetical protein VFF30_08190 [Nitrososphaerales archaeon]|nr:hypothetical protein [Nitrososphaerales archaeon]
MLLDLEMYYLPWLLEIQEKNLGFPDIIQVENENGLLDPISPEEWIELLKSTQNTVTGQESW